jgi:hypothetical protein
MRLRRDAGYIAASVNVFARSRWRWVATRSQRSAR